MASTREAFFLQVGAGQRCFCIYYPTPRPIELGVVLYIHPFAEEMNKSRRMAGLQARSLAEAGYGVLQVDLLGCGDSSGDFGDATWEAWIADVVAAGQWLRARSHSPLWLWGLRAGCLLAVQAAVRLDESPNFLFWQPAISGKVVLQQFLRLKAAGQLLGGEGKGVVDALRKQLESGEPVEVAGYLLSPAIAHGFEAADLVPPVHAGRIEWIEVSARSDAGLAPASVKYLTQWREAGVAVRNHVVSGPAFWQTTEIEEAPELIDATLVALGSPDKP